MYCLALDNQNLYSMKKFIFLSLLVVLALSSCATTHYGIRGGLNLANINGDDTDNLSTRTGIFFGGFGEFGVTDMFAIQPEVLFSQQGAEYEDSEAGGEFFDGRFKLDYLNAFFSTNLSPVLQFAHDVNGNTPLPIINFIEGRKSVTLALQATYQNSW